MNRTDSDLEVIAGRWKVTEIPRAARVDLRAGSMEEQEAGGELIGLVVVLGSQGEVAWEVPPGAPDGVLLFQTSSAHLHKNTLTFVGGEHGCCFTFKVKGEPEAGWMVLESDIDDEGTHISLTLSKEGCSVAVMDNYFSLKKALDECLFSDVMFTCCDGRGVQAHRAVLAAAYPDMQEADWLALFQTQPLHLSQLLLSCIYSDCLPQDLTVIHAKQVVAWLAGHPKLERLSHLMSAFIEGNTLKQKLICLIDELLALLQDAKKTVSIMDMTDSTKVKYTIQHLSKDAALGAAKFVLLCQLYTSNRKEMCKSDRREVLEHLRARVVVFMDLVRELSVEAVQKWEALSQVKQLEVASDLLPDVEQVWDLFLHHATDLRAPLSHTLDRKREVQRGAGISMMLHLISHGSERKRLHKLRKELLDSVEIAQRKREQWQKFSEQEKARQVLNVVGKLVNEIEGLQESMEIRKRQLLLENGLEWRTFHSYVDTACMYMTWGLQKMHSLRDHLKPLLYKVLKFVGRSEVNEAMVYLGLLGRAELEVWLEEGGGDPAADPSSLKLPKSLSRMHPGLEPTRAAESVLAQACVQLASSGHYADMNFVLPSLEGEGSVVIPAHRVIVASRCEWACRALQSGMKEDLEKRIPVPGVDEGVFRLFLQYLYGDPLDTSSMTTESLVDLMEVADRFESHILLSSCESVLVDKIEESSVFPLLAVAERYNARHLRESTMQYILLRPDVIMQEVEGYSSLSESLQQELRDLLSGTQDPMLALRHSQPASVCATTSPSLEQGYPQSSESGASSEDEEELQLESDAAVWEAALEDLQAIVGAEVSNDVLRDLLLAADMDVNRAVNFFFNSQ